MAFLYLFLVLSLAWSCFQIFNSILRITWKRRLPPGPIGLPVIGSILALGKSPHVSLSRLSKRFGPLMSLKLGTRTTIVVSSPQMAKEVLQKQDHVFSGRTIPCAMEAFDHHKFSMPMLPAAAQWRSLRAMCKEHVFSLRSLNASRGIRQKKMQQLVAYVKERCASGEDVDLGRAAFTTTLNLISNTLFSMDLGEYRDNSTDQFNDIICSLVETSGIPNVVDFFPLLKWMDPQGINRKSENYMGKLLAILDGILSRRRLEKQVAAQNSSSTNKDFLDVLLELSKEDQSQLSDNLLKHLLIDLFVAGIDASSNTIEWAMAELLKNPNKMAKARDELKHVIGNDGIVEESDISKLPYLQAIVKETLRLHPPVPFLIPHKAEADAEINGFLIPKNSQVLVNVWSMGRDPDIWSDPHLFTPERFLDAQVDFVGNKCDLIPFGAGRRMCPGQPLGYRMVHSIVGSLLLSFDWKLKKGMLKPEDIDMSETFGLTLQKTVPLEAFPMKV